MSGRKHDLDVLRGLLCDILVSVGHVSEQVDKIAKLIQVNQAGLLINDLLENFVFRSDYVIPDLLALVERSEAHKLAHGDHVIRVELLAAV